MEDGVFVKPQSQLLAKVDYTEFSVEHYSDNVLLVHYKAPHDVDVALIEKVNTEIYRMVAEQPYVVIVFAEPGVNFTPEGRAYGAKRDTLAIKKLGQQ